jgi:hypothetical protein
VAGRQDAPTAGPALHPPLIHFGDLQLHAATSGSCMPICHASISKHSVYAINVRALR